MTEQGEPLARALPSRAEVVVVGAGLAGLACARHLTRVGLDVVVIDKADAVGGRVRTDVVNGFLCDRGFQLLNPAYPEVPRVLDVPALRLQSFPAAIVVASGRSRHTLADPRRAPQLLPQTIAAVLSGGLGSVRELAAFARWGLRTTRTSAAELLREPDTGWGEALSRIGVNGRLRSRLVEPFLAGVLGERDGSSSHRFTQLLVRSFVRGSPAVPWQGMQAIPDQLAHGLNLFLGVEAQAVTPGAVQTGEGEVTARCVVVATDPPTASRLLELPPTPMRALTTFWHVSPEPPTRSGALHVDGDRRGPVVNSIVITNRARSYSPDDRSLIATTVLGDARDKISERSVLAQVETMYGQSTRWWELMRRSRVPNALTSMPPPLQARLPVALSEGLIVAGDHRDTASIQGALVSGRRAAEAVLEQVGRPSAPRREQA